MKFEDFFPDIPPSQRKSLEQLVQVFFEWNQRLNLSAIRDPEGILIKHIVDSLLILPFGWIKDGQKVLDMGTGGGFPGLALAIIYPKTSFTLVDATEKKIRAVQAMANELGLKNIKTVAGRAEDLGRDRAFRERFDVVTARALAGFSTLLEYCLPFVRVGGKFVAYQGPELLETWKQYRSVAQELSSGIIDVQKTLLPGENAERCFIVLKKMRPLSQKYPRNTGIPKKMPLKLF